MTHLAERKRVRRMKFQIIPLTLVAALVLIIATGPVLATATKPAESSATLTTASLCDRAAYVASREIGVPVDVLLAITRVETGMSRQGAFRPWPWTINVAGRGHYYATADEAIDHIERVRARGQRSFDIGCFQINHLWHGQAFASIPAMFDPTENARYAAKFLKKLHREMGSWNRAIGAYHSRTSARSATYRNKVEKMRRKLPADALKPRVDTPRRQAKRTNQNAYPLLRPQARTGRSPGSLVPVGQGRGTTLLGG